MLLSLKHWIRKWSLRACLMVQNIFLLLQALGYLTLTKGWNREYLGISDYYQVLLTSSLVGSIKIILLIIPLLSYFSKLTPAKIEGSLFALLSGVMNLSLL